MQNIKSIQSFPIISLILSLVFALGLVPFFASAQNSDDNDLDTPIMGTALERASEAALDYIGEGRVTDTEAADENGVYEVEITRDDGTQVDVHLDEDFNVLNSEEEADTNENASIENLNESMDENRVSTNESTLMEDNELGSNLSTESSILGGTSTLGSQNTTEQDWESVRVQIIQLLQQLILLLQQR